MGKVWASAVVVSSAVLVIAAGSGCSGSSGNDDLNGDGGSVLGGFGGLGGGDPGAGNASKVGARDGGTAKAPSGGDQGGADAVCKLQTANASCGQCLETSCCTEIKGCAANQSCVQLDGCFGQCGDDRTCLETCVQQHPNGVPSMKAFLDCVQTVCGSECQ